MRFEEPHHCFIIGGMEVTECACLFYKHRHLNRIIFEQGFRLLVEVNGLSVFSTFFAYGGEVDVGGGETWRTRPVLNELLKDEPRPTNRPPTAIIETTAGNTRHIVTTGEKIDAETKVVSIESKQVVLETNGEQRILRLQPADLRFLSRANMYKTTVCVSFSFVIN